MSKWLLPTILLAMMAVGTHALAEDQEPIADTSKLHLLYTYTMWHGKPTLDRPRTTDRLRNAFMGPGADHQIAMSLSPQYAGPCTDPILEAEKAPEDGPMNHLWLMITCTIPVLDHQGWQDTKEHIFVGIRIFGPNTYENLLSRDGTIMTHGILLYPAGYDDPDQEMRKADPQGLRQVIRDALEAIVKPEK